jgi:hypothetical protein
MPLFFLNTQTMHIKSIEYNSSATITLKPYIYPGGIRTRVSYSRGDAMSAAPRRQGIA